MKYNFVAKHVRQNKGGKMADKKQLEKLGKTKHKKPYVDSY
jgi:hypothetical protein